MPVPRRPAEQDLAAVRMAAGRLPGAARTVHLPELLNAAALLLQARLETAGHAITAATAVDGQALADRALADACTFPGRVALPPDADPAELLLLAVRSATLYGDRNITVTYTGPHPAGEVSAWSTLNRHESWRGEPARGLRVTLTRTSSTQWAWTLARQDGYENPGEPVQLLAPPPDPATGGQVGLFLRRVLDGETTIRF